MASNSDFFLKKALGEDFIESLTKFELWKPGTRTVIDHEEIKTALHIVPRVLMSMLIRELSSMEIGQTKELQLPISSDSTKNGMVRVTKHERDVYSGEIEQENKKVVDFKYRSIPGVGLIIMSAFELYDAGDLVKEKEPEYDSQKIQYLIDERLALRDLIHKVVDEKLAQRDAIKELVLAKLTEGMKTHNLDHVVEAAEILENKDLKKGSKKESPLKGFLENRKNKEKPKEEFVIKMSKGEQVDCPDCGKNIFDGTCFSGCVCLGDDRDRQINIRKTEEGIKIRFGRGWDVENIEMLLEVLRRKRG